MPPQKNFSTNSQESHRATNTPRPVCRPKARSGANQRKEGLFTLASPFGKSIPPTPLRVCTLLLLCVLGLTGCAQRIRAEVNAVVEQGYAAQGETFTLGPLPGFPPEADEQTTALLKTLEDQLTPALLDMGYVPAPAGSPPEVRVHVYWYSTGPHPVYHTEYVGGDGLGRWRRWHRRQVLVVSDEYQRSLVVEAVLQDPAMGKHGQQPPCPTSPDGAEKGLTLAQSVGTALDQFERAELRKDDAQPTPPRSDYAPTPPALSLRQATEALPAAPQRLLWRVRVVSQGNLARAERVLSELGAAALPYLGKSALVQVVVQGEDVVQAYPMP